MNESYPRCDQCDTRTVELSSTEYGLLCVRCAFRQAQYDAMRAGAEMEDV